MVLRELVTKWSLKVDDRQLRSMEEGLARVKKNLMWVAGSATALGAVLFGAAKTTGDYANELHRSALRLGMNSEALQEFQYVAKLANIGAGQLTLAFQRLGANVAEAQLGTGQAADILKKLLGTAKGLQDVPLDVLFMRVANALQGVSSQSEKLMIMTRLFGRAGFPLLNVMSDPAALEGLRKEARQLGLIMSGEDVEVASRFGDTWTTMKSVVIGFKNAVAMQVIPSFEKLAQKMFAWWKANREIVTQGMAVVIGEIARAGKLLFNVLWRGGGFVSDLVREFGGLENVIKLAKIAMVSFLAATTLMALAQIAKGVWAIATAFLGASFSAGGLTLAVVLLAAALALLIEDFVAMKQGKESVIGFWLDFFDRASSVLANLMIGLRNLGASGVNITRDMIVGGLNRLSGQDKQAPQIPMMDYYTEEDFKPRSEYYGKPTGRTSIPDKEVNINVHGLSDESASKVIREAVAKESVAAEIRAAMDGLFGESR